VRIRASLAAVLGIVGFLTLVASSGVDESRRGAESRRAGLVRLIRQRQSEVDQLGTSLVKLRGDVLRARHQLSAQSGEDARRVRNVQIQAGTMPMKGRGLEVRLSDSDRQARDPADQGALTLHDVDLQLVVNALWGAGAEAMAVNGQRLVATSPIRAAGETITVNFRPLVPPYRVVAIGAGKHAFDRSEVARQFRHWVDDFGLGFSVKERSGLAVPAYLGTLQLSAARATDADRQGRREVVPSDSSSVPPPMASRGASRSPRVPRVPRSPVVRR
jgi:uncharacterized protein YlxW (UPF0749 family)